MSTNPPKGKATWEDLLGIDSDRVEIIHGSFVDKASPSGEHATVELAAGAFVHRRFHRKPGGRWPGGWWIGTEIHIELQRHEVFCPDLAGWRRERMLQPPSGFATHIRPDWVCEVLSPSNARIDLVDKLEIYRDAGVPHDWLLDPEQRTLVVHRLEAGQYVVALTARSGAIVRAEPFHEVELPVGLLFGEVDDED